MNLFLETLSEECRKHMFEEKWLIAPDKRSGNQWLETITRNGQSAININVKTIKSMALDIAALKMTQMGVSLISPIEAEVEIDRIWGNLKTTFSNGYLSKLKHDMDLSRAIYKSINSMRLAGLSTKEVLPGKFENKAKGQELSSVLDEYLKSLKKNNRIDYSDVLRTAIEIVQKDAKEVFKDIVILMQKDRDLHGLEKQLIKILPNVIELPGFILNEKDYAACPPETNLDLLRHLKSPADAPEPFDDQSVEVFHSVGRMNEVREVIRRCLSKGISFDQVELLHTNADHYIPLIFETIEKTNASNGETKLLATFAEGIPVSYSRPGRALMAWLQWIELDYPQKLLVRMIQDGLLEIKDREKGDYSYGMLARLLRSVPIGLRKDRYEKTFQDKINGIKADLADKDLQRDVDDIEIWRASKERKLRGYELLDSFIKSLIKISPSPNQDSSDILSCALEFVKNATRGSNEIDNFARTRLASDIQNLKNCIDDISETISMDVWGWLKALPLETSIMGTRPLPGHLHIDNIHSGGNTGRPYTFIVGMDDTLFPGTILQDPLILDEERKALSPDLQLSIDRIKNKLKSFAELLSRINGNLTLSFPSHDLLEDRDMFPAPILVDIFRIITEHREGNYEDFTEWIGLPVSYVTREQTLSTDGIEWLLSNLLSKTKVKNSATILNDFYPHLTDGEEAIKQRSSDKFTPYDGYVPEAGKDKNPFDIKNGPIMSASRLEKAGACPLAFFYAYILNIEPPDTLDIDPYVWLDQLSVGSMMHTVFELFYKELVKDKRSPSMTDEKRLFEILDEQIKEVLKEQPPPSEIVFNRQYEDLRAMAHIFLTQEVESESDFFPAYMEASIGLPVSEEEKTPFDTPDPVTIELPSGAKIRTRGRIDRIDRDKKNDKRYHVLDYKTGSTYKYRNDDPFNGGRIVQHLLYIILVASCLKEKSKSESEFEIDGFTYFFPSKKADGEKKTYPSDILLAGAGTLETLCKVIESGSFAPTNDKGDCSYCDYKTICGDITFVTQASKTKIDCIENKALKPFRELRTK